MTEYTSSTAATFIKYPGLGINIYPFPQNASHIKNFGNDIKQLNSLGFNCFRMMNDLNIPTHQQIDLWAQSVKEIFNVDPNAEVVICLDPPKEGKLNSILLQVKNFWFEIHTLLQKYINPSILEGEKQQIKYELWNEPIIYDLNYDKKPRKEEILQQPQENMYII